MKADETEAAVAISMSTFKRAILVFWALWWLVAFLTDVLGGLQKIGVIGATGLPLTNYSFLVKSLAMYHVPGWLPAVFFVGIVAWSGLSTLLFALAAATPPQPAARWRQRMNTAFILSLGLWLVFFLADQVILNFDLEENHMVQGGFQLLTFMAMYVLPDERPA